MDPKKKVEEMLKRAREIQAEQSKPATQMMQVIPTKTVEVLEETIVSDQKSYLPEVYTGVSSLSLSNNVVTTKEQVLDSLKPDQEVYGKLTFTAEQGSRIKKAMGRMTTGASSVLPMVCRGSGCSYHTKCVDGETSVLTNFGSMRSKIKDLKKGDSIFSLSEDNYIVKDVVMELIDSGFKECFKVVTEHYNEIIVTYDHPFKTYNSKTQEFKWLPLSVIVEDSTDLSLLTVELEDNFTENFNDVFLDRIVHIEEVGFKHVYDISVKNNHNFVAENLIVHNCPYYKEDANIVGEDCLPEVQLIEYWTQRYIEEFDIDMGSITELHTVSRLVEITIKEQRMNLYMSIHDQDLMQDFVMSIDEAGNQITNKGVSTASVIREQLDKSKIKLLETLNATRERKSKIQLGAMKTIGESSNLASIKNTLETLALKMAREQNARTVN